MALTAMDLLLVIKARDDASSVLGGVGNTIGKLGLAAVAAGAGMAAGLGVGIKAAGDLQQAVANISTIKPQIDTAQVFTQLNEIATRVPQTAKELGDGLYNIFSSLDVTQQQAIGLVETFAKGAVGASTDAGTFGTAAIGVMNAYGLAVEDAGHISDVFFNTVKSGVVTGEELAGNLGLLTQAAKMAGVDLDSLGGFIAGVTKEGGSAAQNMNNLNNLFLKITTKEAAAAFHGLGIATADSTGAFRPQIDVLGDLKVALAGMTEEARSLAIQKIFPDLQARAGAAVILDQLDFVKAAIAENQVAVGSAEAAYAKMSATFNSQSKLLGNAFTAMLTTLGAQVLPMITPMLSAFATALPGAMATAGQAIDSVRLRIGEGLQSIADTVAKTGAGWAVWAAQAGPAGEVVSASLSAVSGVIQALQLLLQGNFSAAWSTATAALGQFASPAALVNAAIKAIQDQFVAFAPTGERVGAAFDTIAGSITGLILSGQNLARQFTDSGTAAQTTSLALNSLVTAVNGVSAGFAGVTKFVQDNVAVQALLVAGLTAAATIWGLMTAAAIAHAVATNAVRIATVTYTAVQWLLNAALTANPIGLIIVALAALAAGLIYAYNNSEEFRAVVDAAFAAVLIAGRALIEFVKTLPGTIQGALNTAGNAFSSFGTNVQAVLAAIGGFFSNIGTQIQAGLASIGGFFSGLGTTVRSGLDAVGTTVGGFFSNVGAQVQTGIRGIGAFFSDLGTKARVAISAVGEAFSSLGSVVRGALDTIGSSVGAFFSSLGSAVRAGLDAIEGFFFETWNRIPQDIRDDLGLVASLIVQLVAHWLDVFQDGLFAIGEAFRHGWDVITSTVGGAVAQIVDTIVQGWGNLSSTVGTFMSALGAVVRNGWDAITSTVAGFMSGLRLAIQDGWDAITSTVGAAMSLLGTTVNDGWTAIGATVDGFMSGLRLAIQDGWDAISASVGGAMSALGSAVHDGWDAIIAVVTTVVSQITTDIQAGWDTIVAAAGEAWTGISTAISTALDAAIAVVTKWIADVLAFFTGMGSDMGKAGRDAGQSVVDGLVAGIGGGFQAVGDKAAELARSALAAMTSALPGGEPHSPWPAFVKLGASVGEGLIAGIRSMQASVSAEMGNSLKSAVTSIKSGGGNFLTVPQFGSAIRGMGFNETTISAICGPIAAQGIAEGLGKSISLIDVEAISSKIGAYAKGAGTFGSGAFQKILSAIGIDSRSGSFSEAVDAAMKGIPVAISTPLHYFLAQGFDSATQQFVVGNTGTALKRGAEKMTAAAIEGVAGAATFIIPSVLAAGAAVRTLSDTIGQGFVDVATPAVYDLEAAITDLVGTNDLWQQLDANASQTGRDLATFLGDIAAPGIDIATASLQELQAMSGLTLPEIQVQAAAAGQDMEHWLMDVGVPAAQRLALEFQNLQDRAGPALEATGVSLLQLGKDIEASFTTTAPTAIDKFFGLLEQLAADVDRAGDDIASKMDDIAIKVSSGIAKATEDGARQIADAMRSAQDQLDQLGGSLADPTSTTVKQSGLAGEISAAKAMHAQQRSDADQLFSHKQDLARANTQFEKDSARAAIQLDKDLARARSDVERSGVIQKAADARAALNEAHKLQIDSLDTGFAQKVADNARSRAMDAADRAFNLAEDAKMVKFREAVIIADRDAKILIAQETTAGQVAAVLDGATKERAILAQSYKDKIADLKAGLLAKLPGLTGQAAVVVQGVLDRFASEAVDATATITGSIGTASDAVQALIDQYDISFAQASKIVSDHGTIARRVLGIGGTLPQSFDVTDQAVEDFADAFQVNWDTARKILEDGGALSDAVMRTQIPGAAKATVTALDTTGQAHKDLLVPIGDVKSAAALLAKDGFDAATDASDKAKDAATQISYVLQQLSDKMPALNQGIKDFVTELMKIPAEIKINIATNQVGGGAVAAAGSGSFAQSGIAEGSNRNRPADTSNVSPFPASTIGSSGPGGKYNDPSTGRPYTRAGGGPVKANWPYLIGEDGPEMFVSAVAGSIVPNGDLTKFLSKALGQSTGKQQTPADYVKQVSDLLGKLPRSVPVQIRASVAAGGLGTFVRQLGGLPESVMVGIEAQARGVAGVVSTVMAQFGRLPETVQVPLLVDPGRSNAILEHLQDTFDAIPPSVTTLLEVDMGSSLRLIDQFTDNLAALPSNEQVMVHLNTAAAERDLARLQDQIAEPTTKAGPSSVDVAMIASPQSSGSSKGVEIDYDRLGEAFATRMGRVLQNQPAPRVAVEDIRSSLVAIGQRNGGFVGLA